MAERSDAKPGKAMLTILVTLTLRLSVGSTAPPRPSEQDTCILYQKSIRMGLSTYDEHVGTSWPEMESLIAGISDRNEAVSWTIGDNNTINVTKDENETVVVKVKARAENDNSTEDTDAEDAKSANVTANTTDIKIEHRVVKGHTKNHVVESDIKTASNGTDNESSSSGESTSVDARKKEFVDKTEPDIKTKSTENQTKGGPEKAFAKENITVHKHVLNITRRVNETNNKTQNVTITETVKVVDLASPFHIASIYMLLFVPVAVAWALYFHHGMQPRHYIWLLPVTMCTMSIGQDLVNQSLTMILEAPNAISAIQGFSMTVAMFLWLWFADWSALRLVPLNKFSNWLGVAVLFAFYQLMNHIVYNVCTLSERTVITNLSPLMSLTFERLLMPANLKPSISFASKIALSLMVVGAILFSIQSPSFTLEGICVALILLITTVPYRLAQRHCLADAPELPLSALACIDGFVLGVPSALISFVRYIHFWSVVETSTEVSVFFMLSMSILTFVGLHISGLAMLRLGSATTYLVFTNIASIVTISLGIFFFGDQALGTGLACIGLFANVASGIWYSAEVQANAIPPEESPQQKKMEVEN